MPITEYLAESLLNQVFPGTAYSFPATLYVGLLIAPTWQASTAYSVGNYVIGTAFASSNRHIFKATSTSGSGTSGGSEPSWNQTAGATTTDNAGANQVVWTECTLLFDGGTFTAAEASGNNYSRVTVTCNSTNWNNATAGPPAQMTNKAAFTFASPTNTGWGQAVSTILGDNATPGVGNILTYTLLTAAVGCGGGSVPTIPVSSYSVALGNGTAGP